MKKYALSETCLEKIIKEYFGDLKMVKNNEAVYIKLKSRFDKIIERNNKKSDNIVDLIFEVGLDKAMEQFNI